MSNCHMMPYILLYTVRNGILPMGFISQVVSILAFTATLCGPLKFFLLWINFCKNFYVCFPEHLPINWTASVLKGLHEALFITSLYSKMWQFNPAYFWTITFLFWTIIFVTHQLQNGLHLVNSVSLKFLYLSYSSIGTSIWRAKME